MLQYGIPEVFESEAQGVIKDIYEDIKYVLKVPIVNFIFRALALYPEFLVYAWGQVRPNLLTTNIESAANQLRFPKINLQIPFYDFSKDYNPETLRHIQDIVTVFQYVNPKLLLIASSWAESIGDRPIISKKNVEGFIEPGVFDFMPQIEIIHIPKAPVYVRQLLLDIAKEHHSFDAASDFRALAQFPRFFEVTWHYLKYYIKRNEYTILKSKLLSQAVTTAHEEMPYPVTISKHYLSGIYSPSQISGIMGLVSYFQNFLPGLIVEIEFIRRMLHRQSS